MFRPLFNVLSRGKLTVLLFHKVPLVKGPLEPHELDLAGFEQVLRRVQRMFRVLPLDEALLALRAGNLPPRAACITFDDGYPDWLKGVVPMLEREKVPATFFITTGQFAGLPMWNERILHAVANAPTEAPVLEMPDGVSPLSFATEADRLHAIAQLDQYLKYQPPEKKEHLLQLLEQHTGRCIDQVPVMSTDDLRALHSRGFGIGGHAVSHPILARCSPEQAYAEIGGAREELEAILRDKVTAFAYPNGVPERDFGPEHVEMVRRAGYTSAVTTYKGVATAGTSLFQIPRFTPWGPSELRMQLQAARNLMQHPEELDEADQGGKRALMVAFHFPPQAGSSGILRTLNFAKYLPQNGWQPTILTAQPKAYVEQRNDLVASIPPQTRVIRAFALDAAKHLAVRGKYPGLFAIPDRWSWWWIPAVWAGMKEIRHRRPALIWSTYPISTAHLIGGTLSRLSGLPWVADFRDPMVSDSYPTHYMQRKVWTWLEAWVMRNAERCVFTTERAAQTYRSRYPAAADKCMVIENGYDEDAFVGNQPLRLNVRDDQLLLLHSGIIYPKDRDPSAFLDAISALIQEGVLQRSKLIIRFRAPHHEEDVARLAGKYGLSDIVDIAPSIPYRKAIGEMMGADLLLVFQGKNFNTQIPAKIYEYMRSGRPVMALLDLAGDTARQLEKIGSSILVDIDSRQDIQSELRGWTSARFEKQRGEFDEGELLRIKRYSREFQAGFLAGILESSAAHEQ